MKQNKMDDKVNKVDNTENINNINKKVEKGIEANKNKKKVKNSKVGYPKGIAGHLLTAGLTAVLVATIGGTYLNVQYKNEQTIAKTKSGLVIDKTALEDIVTRNPDAGLQFSNDVVTTVMYDVYGDKVKDKDVDAMVKATKEAYGDKFTQAISESGFTDEKEYRNFITRQLSVEKAVQAKHKVTKSEMEAYWQDFVPTQDVTVGVFESKEVAEEYMKDPKNAKYNDYLMQSKVGSVSNNMEYPDELLLSMIDLEDGKFSKIVETDTVGGKMYLVAYMNKGVKKGDDYKKFEKDLETLVYNGILDNKKESDEIINKILKEQKLEFNSDSLEKTYKLYRE